MKRTNNFLGIEVQSNLFMAPMAGVTDSVFRRLVNRYGAGISYTEMVSAKGLYYKSKGTEELLDITPEEGNVGIQIFGSEPDMIAFAVEKLEERPNVLIDINMGCPVPKVFRNNEGSALLQNPKLAGELVKAAKSKTKKPVTIKMRLGVSDISGAVDFAKTMQDSGADAVCVHGRTREQYYSGKANWEEIAKIKKALSIPVIGNGDVFAKEDADRMIEETGVDAVMIARGALGNPWIFAGRRPTKEELIEVIEEHLMLSTQRYGEYRAVREARKHISWYTKGFKSAAALRNKINQTQSAEELRELIKEI